MSKRKSAFKINNNIINDIIGLVSNTISVVIAVTGVTSYLLAHEKYSEIIVSSTLSGIALFSIYKAYRMANDERKRYSYMIEDMKSLTYNLGKYYDNCKFMSKDSDNLHILGDIAKIFTKVTNSNCKVKIKLVKATDNPNIVKIYSETEAENNKEVSIHDYSSLDAIVFHKKPHYLCNDIKEEHIQGRYRNKELTTETAPIEKNFFGQYVHKKWPLHYLATLVVPIRRNNMICGFLCIDSDKKNSFSERYDPDLALAVADVLASSFYIGEIRGRRTGMDRRKDPERSANHIGNLRLVIDRRKAM